MANSGKPIQTQRHIRGYFECLKLGVVYYSHLALPILWIHFIRVQDFISASR